MAYDNSLGQMTTPGSRPIWGVTMTDTPTLMSSTDQLTSPQAARKRLGVTVTSFFHARQQTILPELSTAPQQDHGRRNHETRTPLHRTDPTAASECSRNSLTAYTAELPPQFPAASSPMTRHKPDIPAASCQAGWPCCC